MLPWYLYLNGEQFLAFVRHQFLLN
ncbi:hypothetical protein CY0110_19897 [Crocosphaera chwakensis CCY0110]|uniref:Uncharacterized protein n=1 Tax=Crocosphaera chwakensis CCY0110 TaxID=391612 RepID=A3IJW1_9CHRO|nr:hypothetical protein CY0110_19897 [Crocosphaera chwakensis CCY0110]